MLWSRQNINGHFLAWGGIAAELLLQYGIQSSWLFPSLALIAVHYGAQALQPLSHWYRYASTAAMVTVPVLLLGNVIPLAILRIWLEAAMVAFAVLGWFEGRKNR